MSGTVLIWALLALPLLGHAGRSTEPLSQDEVGRVLDSIGKGNTVDRETLHRALISDQTYLRASAARLLGDTGDASSVPHLIAALSDQSVHAGVLYPEAGMATTRYWANQSLKKLSKRDFGFSWEAPMSERQAAVKRWKEWFHTKVSPTKPAVFSQDWPCGSPSSYLARKALIDNGTLHDGMTKAEAEAILGSPTSDGNGLVDWYHNPGHLRHVAAYFRAEVRDGRLYKWQTGNR